MKNTNKLLSLVMVVASTATISFTALAADNKQIQSVNAAQSPTIARACYKAPITSAKQINAAGGYTPQLGGCGAYPEPASTPKPNPKKLCFGGLCITTGS